MRHAQHICINCRLPILPEEPERAVDTASHVLRKRRAGMRPLNSEDAPRRYAHISYEACAEAEKLASSW